MALEEYVKKRDFSVTPEPKGDPKNKTKKNLRFVVQRHDASRLHYDFRLELDGVLKSWAIPKGPSMNPADKRLAIQTEDHPMDYIDFEGVIPEGNYGAGQVWVWDSGTYEPASKEKKSLQKMLDKGDLKVKLNGKKLKGEFVLVHSNYMEKEDHWLLIKKKDEFAVSEKYDAEDHATDNIQGDESELKKLDLNEKISPMLATKTKKSFDDKNWVYEIKWDGYRALANIQGGEVKLYSRNGISFNKKFNSVAKVLRKIKHNVILDGEIVILNKDGLPDFQKLQNYDSETDGDLRYYVFDLLHLNGHDIQHLPLKDRKSLLKEVIADLPGVYYCEDVREKGKSFYRKIVKAGYEGVIAKKTDSKYHAGSRSRSWLKVKANESQEAIICGYTEGERLFGSLILGVYVEGQLVHIGNCGTGFDEAEQQELMKKFKPLGVKKRPFKEKLNLKGREPSWLKPELICEVKFSEWTKTGMMRHPVYKGLRTDKKPSEITKEAAVSPSGKKDQPNEKAESKKDRKTVYKEKASSTQTSSPKKKKSESLEIGGISVPVTNLDKVYWPQSGLTKYDLIDYYIKISETILPYLKDRPQNLNRHPEGIEEEGFYHKDSGQIMPDWVETIKIHSESSEKDIEYMMCQNTASLVYMANLGCIEINPWSSRKGSLDQPDYTVIDIDPSPKTTFEEVVEVAQAGKEVLDRAKIEGYCKTTGSRGLHIYIPLGAKYSYDEAKDFAKLICYNILGMLPKLTTMERNIKKRKGKIYLDFLQNRRGQTLAAPYCLRPKRGAPASAPLEWSEVKSGLDMHDFNIHTMPDRIKSVPDPFKKVLGSGIDMAKALEVLAEEE